MRILRFALIVSVMLLAGLCWAQEPVLYDQDYRPTVADPAFATGQGPLVLLDEAHNNFHTIEGRYHPFFELLTNDGYRVEPNTVPFSAEALADASVLVIANALNAANVTAAESDPWTTPVLPALTNEEIQAVVQWVSDGGSLMLVADHMPFPGAIDALAAQFGVIWQNAFAFAGNFTFVGGDPNLLQFGLGTPGPGGGIALNHPVYEGRSAAERVDFVATFTGSAFRLVPGSKARPVMQLGTGPSSLMAYPTNHIDITAATPFALAVGLLQGATLKHGDGRVALMGEASMFSARKADFISPGFDMGMSNQELAPHNKQFTLNLLHWLSGIIDADVERIRPLRTGLVVSESRVGGSRSTGKLLPETYTLHQNSPNPFNPETEIRYMVPEQVAVRIDVYNSMGQRVRTLVKGQHNPGTYTVTWNGKDDNGRQASAGMYLYKMKAGSFSGNGKMTLLP